AAESGQCRKGQHDPEWGGRIGQCHGNASGWYQQEQCGNHCPVASAETGNHERVGDAQGCPDEAWDGDEPEQFGGAVAESGYWKIDHDDGEELPNTKSEELGKDGPFEVLAGYRRTGL